MTDTQQQQGEAGSRPAAAPSTARAAQPEQPPEPKMTTVVYRGPSDSLALEGHVLLRHEPATVPEEVLDRLAQMTLVSHGHFVERVG